VTEADGGNPHHRYPSAVDQKRIRVYPLSRPNARCAAACVKVSGFFCASPSSPTNSEDFVTFGSRNRSAHQKVRMLKLGVRAPLPDQPKAARRRTPHEHEHERRKKLYASGKSS
jgi:hypothetical protein